MVITGVELNTSYARVTIFGLPDQPGNCSRVFQAVAQSGVVVDMIVQNLASDGRAELSFSVPRDDLDQAVSVTRQAVESIDPNARVVGDGAIAVLYVYGVGMRTHTGVARTMFGALAAQGINILLINTSEVCLSVVVESSRGEEALACLKTAFAL